MLWTAFTGLFLHTIHPSQKNNTFQLLIVLIRRMSIKKIVNYSQIGSLNFKHGYLIQIGVVEEQTLQRQFVLKKTEVVAMITTLIMHVEGMIMERSIPQHGLVYHVWSVMS